MRKIILTTLALLLGLAMAQAPSDTLVISTLPGGPVTLDPVRAYDSASGTIIQNVYETLYYYDEPAIDEFAPLLATDYTVSEDGTTYTFQLRDGVQFHSGNTMTCKDVEYSYEYGLVVAHPEGANVYLLGNQLIGTQQDGSDPAAYQEAVSFDMIDAAVECPEGPDGLVAQINLQYADPAFIAVQAYTAFSILDSEYAIANGMWDGTAETWTEWIGRDVTQEFLHNNMSGTGAYQLVEWSDEATVLQAFDDYWGGEPPLENVVVNYVPEVSTRILSMQEGDADYITLGQRSELVQLEGSPGVVIMEDPEWGVTSVTSLFFNFDIDTSNNEDVGSGQLDGAGIPSDFFADPNVRRGFSHLFDHAQFIDQIYQGEGSPLTMGLPSGFLGYNDDIPIRTLDLELAESFLRDAFGGELWDTGFEFTALYNEGNTTREAMLAIIKDNLEFLNPNFTMNIRSLPWADFLARTGEQKAPMFVLGWGADYADPRNFINTFYSNDGFYSARTSIDLPEMQQLIDEANTIVDPESRALLYEQIGSLHYDLAPLIPAPFATPYMVVSDDLQGVYFNPMRSASNPFQFKDVSK